MISVDSSTVSAFHSGANGSDIDRFAEALRDGHLLLTPTVLSEILSYPRLPSSLEHALLQVPLLELKPNFSLRVGLMRRQFLSKGRRCHLADAQIAQCCMDFRIPLITRDQDFKKFERLGLHLILGG